MADHSGSADDSRRTQGLSYVGFYVVGGGGEFFYDAHGCFFSQSNDADLWQ